jgi:predicted RNase H-like HicB family nuclease
MITYRAAYHFLDDGVHGEVLDFPGVFTAGRGLAEARRLLAAALADLAETRVRQGEVLPHPDLRAADLDADLKAPIHLLLTGSNRVQLVAGSAAS